MKRIALYLDGTWNHPDDMTSVRRLFDVTTQQPGVQVANYWRGVGTKWNQRLRGGAFGMGLTKNVRDAYEWLVDQYEDGDQIYLFGFSRGAFTARSISGLIINCGLLRSGAGMSVDEIFDLYQAGKEKRSIYRLDYLQERRPEELDAAEIRLLQCSRRVPIKMIGVWDTVGSLGIPWTEFPAIGRGNYFFLNTNISKLIEHAYHALAIDEHRGPYEPTLWTKFFPFGFDVRPPYVAPGQTIEQRWFAGAHSNIGGGYGDADKLRRLPLHWMQRRAEACGLQFKSVLGCEVDDHKGELRDSFGEFMKGFYRVLRFGRRFYRPIGAGPRSVTNGHSVPISEVVDQSVFKRYQDVPAYRPKNLEQWASRMGIDLSKQVGDLVA
jgi:uncharacterized protein (DUF2235 family)